MGLLDYIDTSTAKVSRLKKARLHLNYAAVIILFSLFFMFAISFFLYLMGWINTGLYFFGFAVIDTLLFTCLILKREIYSLAILFKEKK